MTLLLDLFKVIVFLIPSLVSGSAFNFIDGSQVMTVFMYKRFDLIS